MTSIYYKLSQVWYFAYVILKTTLAVVVQWLSCDWYRKFPLKNFLSNTCIFLPSDHKCDYISTEGHGIKLRKGLENFLLNYPFTV